MRCPACYLDAVILPQLRERFAHAGYWLLDAADYGVPQHRRRVILWAGPRPLAPPEPTHADPATLAQGSLFGQRLRPWVSMGEALGFGGFCVDPERGAGMCERHGDRPVSTDRDPAPAIRARSKGAPPLCIVAAGETVEGRPRPMDQAATTIGTKGPAYLLRPAPTGRRRLTVEECARLQDFPAGHPFQGTKTAQYRQVGNACPPAMIRAICIALRSTDAAVQEDQDQRPNR